MQKPFKEKRSYWKFRSAEDRTWLWHVTRPDGTEASSVRGFRTLTDCIADAREHGYVAWAGEAERRRTAH